MPRRHKFTAIASLAKLADPFAQIDEVIGRLKLESAESRFLEWKSALPFGPGVALSTKYRMVKAALAFANTDGGFIVFGIEPSGKWIGLTKAELEQTDPAMMVELINGCVLPEVVGLNYTTLQYKKRWFAILHAPPSQSVPHVSTKDVIDVQPTGRKICLNKGAVYCRYGAKCDLATAAQFARMIEKRTAYVKSEMLRRIKSVEIPQLLLGFRRTSASRKRADRSPSGTNGNVADGAGVTALFPVIPCAKWKLLIGHR